MTPTYGTPAPLRGGTPNVQARQVRFAYPQHGLGLRPTDLTAYPGELWTITGRSGCGKSTFIRALNGLIPHLYRGEMGGRVTLLGRDTASTPLWRLCQGAGMVFQNPSAQSLGSSAREEILFGLEHLGLDRQEQAKRCEEALGRFNLEEMADRQPSSLSGGELQRLMLAAVLAREPRVVLLDEPFSMLDSTASAALASRLADIVADGRTVVATEHRPDHLVQVPGYAEMVMDPAFDHATGYGARTPPSEMPVPSSGPRYALRCVRLDGVTTGYSEAPVIDGLTLAFRGGETTAVVGQNGVGKTTILRTLAGMHRLWAGTISTNGGDTPRLGMMFQNPDRQLFNPSVRDEICYRLASPDEDLYRWCLEALSLRLHEAVPPLLLSEGQKKRVALATLLMQRPRDGVLLDEPTLGQDDSHREIIGRALERVAESGAIVVVATHDLLWVSRHADRLVLLGTEGIVADGPADAVIRNNRAWDMAGLALPLWVRDAP